MMPRGRRAPGIPAARRAAELYLQGGVTLQDAADRYGVSRSNMWRHVALLRVELGQPAAARAPGDPQPPGATLAQTIDLLTLQNGRQLQPSARRSLAVCGWIRELDHVVGTRGGRQRRWALTEDGDRALASSPHLVAARRALETGARMGAWR